MSAAAGWLADPLGKHQLRYWDGAQWSAHVSDNGVTAADPLSPDVPPPPPPAAAPAPPPPAVASGGGGFMGKLKAAAAQAADQGKQMAASAKEAVGDQASKRREQYKDDPNTLWMGEGRNPATKSTGISSAFYRVTKDRVWIESGIFGAKSESVPLWAVKDIDVRQSMFQRGSDIGDIVLVLEDATLGTQNAGIFGDISNALGSGNTTGTVILDNIEGPYALRDLLMPLISEARQAKVMERQSQFVHYVTPPPAAPAPAPAAPAAPAAPDLTEQLRKLAALRDEGILTDEEFAAQKAKLLGS